MVGSESEDSDESALSDDERAARLGCKGRPRPTLCFLGSRSAGSTVELQDTQSIINCFAFFLLFTRFFKTRVYAEEGTSTIRVLRMLRVKTRNEGVVWGAVGVWVCCGLIHGVILF